MSSNLKNTHSHQPTAKELQIENRKFLPEVITLLNEGHTVTLQLRGFSMRPFLEDNRDKALLSKAKDIQVGDAVLAETAPKHYVLHRIIKIQGETVTLRGDGNLGTEVCHINDVHGLAIGFYRKGHTKLDKTNGIKWLTYSHIWTALYPIRRYLLAAYRRIWIPLFGPI